MVEGGVRELLKAEGLVLFVTALAAYAALKGSWIMLAVLFFAPDLSFAAYLLGSRAGAIVYNTLHSTIGPLFLGVFGFYTDNALLQNIALIWLAHVGFDRMLGYGLKKASGFKDTHLGQIGR